MSHLTSIKTVVKDVAALKQACSDLGLTFLEGKKTFAWYGRFMNDWSEERSAVAQGYDPAKFGQCEHAIGVPGSTYEIGVVANPAGDGLVLQFDEFGPGQRIIAKTGDGCGLLVQAYAVRVAQKAMDGLRTRGFRPVGVTGQVGVPGQPVVLTYQRG